MIRYILLIFLIASNSYSRQIVIGSADLPYTTDLAYDTITFDASKITSETGGIYVNDHNITIDLQDDTLEFGTNYSSDVYGIWTNGHRQNLTILGNPTSNNGGLILHGGGTSGADSSWGCINVRLLGSQQRNTIIIDVDMEIYGWDGHNVRQHDGPSIEPYGGLTITGGHYITHNEGFTSRCSFSGVAMYLQNPATSPAIISNIIMDTWHSGIFFYGSAIISSCSLLVDAKNDLYWPGDDDDNFCHTSALSAGITSWAPGYATEIYNNIIIAGVDNEGCEQGISTNYAQGTITDTIKIYGNFAILHRGPDDHYGSLTTKFYKHRWGGKYVHIYDNEAYIYLHTDSGDHAAAYGANGEGFDMLWTYDRAWSEGEFVDSFIVIENNHTEVWALSDGCTSAGVRITVRGEYERPQFDFTAAGNVWRNNYFGSSSVGLDLGKGDGGKSRTFLSVGDTLEPLGDYTSGYNTIEMGAAGGYVSRAISQGGQTDASLNLTVPTFTGSPNPVDSIEIEIVSEGTPDQFRWRKNNSSWSSNINVSTSFQSIVDGIQISWDGDDNNVAGNVWKIWTAYDGAGSFNNVVRDLVYLGTASDNDVTWDAQGQSGDEIFFERTINIIVNGNDELPVDGATVYIINSYDSTLLDTTTSADGIASKAVTYLYLNKTFADTTYDDFTLTAIYDGDTTTTTRTLLGGNGSVDVTLVLLATGGESPVEQTENIILKTNIKNINTVIMR